MEGKRIASKGSMNVDVPIAFGYKDWVKVNDISLDIVHTSIQNLKEHPIQIINYNSFWHRTIFSLSVSVCAVQKAHTAAGCWRSAHVISVLWLEIYKHLSLPGVPAAGLGPVDASHYRAAVKLKVDYHSLWVFLHLNFGIFPVLLVIDAKVWES